MLAEIPPSVGNGIFTADIEVGASINSVLVFIEVQFAAFSVYLRNDASINADTNEDSLNDKLCKFLQRKSGGYPFCFHHQHMEDYSSGNSAKVDIGTIPRFTSINIGDRSYGVEASFFSIEGKRLPTPKRKKEYVIGKDKPRGGVERFKKGIHGNGLTNSALIAYVQKKDFDYWLVTINGWIDELVTVAGDFWYDEDKLIEKPSVDNLVKFLSHNLRLVDANRDYIDLHHFWIEVGNK